MKSHKPQKQLALNPNRLPPVKRPAKKIQTPRPAPPQPEGRTGKVVYWTDEEKALLALYQSRGEKQKVVEMMREKQNGIV